MPLIQSSDSLPNFLHTLFCPKVSITTALYCHPSTYRLFYCESAVARAARAAQRTSRRAHIRPPCATQTGFTQSESVPAGGQVIQPQRPSICAIQANVCRLIYVIVVRICCKQGQPAYLRLSPHPPLPPCCRSRCRCGKRRRRFSSNASMQSLILLCSPYPTQLPSPLGASHSPSCPYSTDALGQSHTVSSSLPLSLPPHRGPPPPARAGLALLRRPAQASPSSAGPHRPAPA